MLHVVHQGVAPYAIASLVTHHFMNAIGGITLGELDRQLKTEAWQHYKNWCRTRKSVVCPTSSMFSSQRFGRDSWQTYPELASCYKGAMVKYLIFWTDMFLQEKVAQNDTEQNRLRAHCAYSLAQFQFLQKSAGRGLRNQWRRKCMTWDERFCCFTKNLLSKQKGNSQKKKCIRWCQSSIVFCTCASLW